ncbi:hypothetical protein FDA33_10080 [Clostridium botulinum]|uniref:Prokaryotic E2 family_D protein n=1 Tax=Clostridium botulinum TaxID=1491 RepID=A0A126JHT5_CLOBO|nr:hypothetical protein [Clostridium botulinum]ALT05347.1 prokaryotic E2 family_D protein [Clostridium botulinum]NFH90540.1 hypothetical protein [Clostridium botulinum]NFI17224.1 hypothetical protein [Clostridium botulinum]NFN06160.1 hypothetical protein [Clostridium botulinum]NFN19443.1 hypothetical protein [Clostridium botulinum]
MKKIYIELIDGSKSVNMVQVLEEGQKKEKLISIEDFVTSITASLDGKNFEEVKSPIFRDLRGVRLIQSKQVGKNSHTYVLFQAKHNTPFQLFNRFYENVGVPNLLYGVKVVNNRLSKLYVVAIKDTNIVGSTKLYKYPFTNVSGNLGSACLGRNVFDVGIEDNDLEKLYSIPNQFMSMPNNLDYYRIQNNNKCYECEQLLKVLNNNIFDNDLLVENDIMTYANWFNQL